ncbi:MAG: hypothetical protein HKN50_00465 [Gammaproteobacteria bacterium]|nr:hypothetical protein [Gammaproteobacteria bacterium]
MSVNWSDYSLEQLRQYEISRFRKGAGSRPDVLLIEIEGQRAVLKDQSAADRWFAMLIGPLLSWRECKALARLSSVNCVPDLLARPCRRSFVMQYLDSEPITRAQRIEPVWPDFFERLTLAVDQIHKAGIAHNDLRNPTNILVTPAGEPVLVDLVAAFGRGANWNVLNRWIFGKFCQVDRSAITKLKTRVAPELLNHADVQAEQIAGRAGMALRSVGQAIRRLSRKLFTD